MKDQFLKLAGVKSEKEFYKKFPTEELFMAKYGAKLKKVQLKKSIDKAQTGFQTSYAPDPIEVQSFDYAGNQKQIDKAVNKNRRQVLRQGVGIDSNEGVADESIQKGGLFDGINKINSENVNDAFTATSTIGSNVQKVSGAIADKKGEKEKYKLLSELSPLIAQASSTVPEQVRKYYNRPDNPMNMIQPGQLYNPYGEGTNVLAAKNGAEIANTFAPNTIYKDLEKAQTGAEMALISEGVNTLGDQASLFFDIGRQKYQKKNDQLIGQMGIQPGIQNIQNSYVSHMEDGGMINPQMIKSFNGIPLTKLLAEDPYMDTLRTGGNIRQNNMAMGGDLKTHWGGYAEPMSYNPYLPNGGETVMFRGRSHDESVNGKTGIGITYGDQPVEVERGEPAVQLKNGTNSSSNLTVFGNLEIPKYGVDLLEDPNAKGKFKKYIADLSKVEKGQNKLIDTSVTSLDNLEMGGSFSDLSLNSYKSNILGANMKLKNIADKKIKASNLQSAINDTAEEYGFEADALSKGKVKQAKMGTSIQKAQRGFTLDQQAKAKRLYESGDTKAFQEYAESIAPKIVNSVMEKYGAPTAGVFNDSLKGKRTDEVYSMITNPESLIPAPSAGMASRNPFSDPTKLPANMPGVNTNRLTSSGDGSGDGGGSEFDWMNIANQILPYMRPTDSESLDPRQLAGEMYALSTNQLEPVQAQSYQPQLSTPYDISLQDQLNANQSDYRAAQRMMGYNPAAQAMLNAQKYEANQGVLGEQFRLNQAMKDKVYGENRNILNDAQLKNLAIYDNQYERQSAAKSNTKATTQAALNSISSKYAQNQLENRQSQTYENLYNFRYDSKGRAINMNPLQQFDTELASMSSQEIEQLAKQRAAEEKTKAKGSNVARNGSIVRSYK